MRQNLGKAAVDQNDLGAKSAASQAEVTETTRKNPMLPEGQKFINNKSHPLRNGSC
jgi:hypothetical protein